MELSKESILRMNYMKFKQIVIVMKLIRIYSCRHLHTHAYIYRHTHTHTHTHEHVPFRDVCTVYVTRHSGPPDKLTSAPHAAVTMSLLVCASSSNSVSSHRVRIRYPVTPLNRVRLPKIISGKFNS